MLLLPRKQSLAEYREHKAPIFGCQNLGGLDFLGGVLFLDVFKLLMGILLISIS